MTDFFIFCSIFLRCKCEGDEGGLEKLCRGSGNHVQWCVAVPQQDISDAERVRRRPGVAKFAWSEEKEEGKPHEVGGREGAGVIGGHGDGGRGVQ